MTKTFFILLLLAVIAPVVISAQVKTSIEVCPQLNEKLGIRTGMNLDIPINSRWSFIPGVYWSLKNRAESKTKKTTNSDTKTTYKDQAQFLTLPLQFGLRVPCKNEKNFAMKILFGPYFAYGIDGTSKATIRENGTSTPHKVNAFASDGRYCYRWDYGINYGLNTVIKQHYKIGIFHELGFRKIYRANDTLGDIIGEILAINKINIAFGLTLGYQF